MTSSYIIQWALTNWIEITGTLSGLIYIILSIKENIWLWPVGLIASVFSLLVFLNSKLYADMLLQVYYIIISIYGFIYWNKKNGTNKTEPTNEELPIVNITLLNAAVLLIITSILAFTLYQVLIKYTDASVPFWDSVVTAASLVATWMLARKQIENWLLWIVIDFISMFLFIYKELYFFAALFLIYTFLAIIGYLKWRNTLKNALNK